MLLYSILQGTENQDAVTHPLCGGNLIPKFDDLMHPRHKILSKSFTSPCGLYPTWWEARKALAKVLNQMCPGYEKGRRRHLGFSFRRHIAKPVMILYRNISFLTPSLLWFPVRVN